jgi:predicted nucleic acid-binding protein
MTVVVADTSPLNYLVLIGEAGVLPRLYGKVFIPPEVLAELADSDAPPQVLEWIRARPEWLEVRAVRENQSDPALQQIDPGERAAILLAQEEPDSLLLIDDAAGRAEANRRRIQNTGTLGVLKAAAVLQFLDLPAALTRLAGTNFRVLTLCWTLFSLKTQDAGGKWTNRSTARRNKQARTSRLRGPLCGRFL